MPVNGIPFSIQVPESTGMCDWYKQFLSIFHIGGYITTPEITDKQGKGVYANASKGEERLIAKQFSLDFSRSCIFKR